MLDLNDVALFVQVVRYGSFAEAARRMGIPSNTVSRRVQQLEAQLGSRLLQRSTRKLTLTDAGKTFHERCAGAVDDLADAGQALMMGSQESSGLMRVAVPADFFDVFQMEWVAEFMALYPKMRLEFVLSDDKADLIADQIDVAFRGGPLNDLGYVSRQILGTSSSGLVASPAYIAEHGQPETLQDVAGFDCVGFSHPSGFATWRLDGPDGVEEEVQVTCRFIGNTAQSLRKASMAGLGITLLPTTLTHADLQAGRLVSVLPQYQRAGLSLNALYPSRKHLPVAVSAFMELVKEKIGQIFCCQAG